MAANTRLVFVHRTGDESEVKIDAEYPVFAIAAVVMTEPAEREATQRLKDHFVRFGLGRDAVFDLGSLTRGLSGSTRKLRRHELRASFWDEYRKIFEESDFSSTSIVYDKRTFTRGVDRPAGVTERVLPVLILALKDHCEDVNSMTMFRAASGESGSAFAQRTILEAPFEMRNSAGLSFAQAVASSSARMVIAKAPKNVFAFLSAEEDLRTPIDKHLTRVDNKRKRPAIRSPISLNPIVTDSRSEGQELRD